ncbi:MAG TPA: hypothetical protein VGZ93_02235 [Candidatus Methylacidiphilales bacterium]|jgi:hypothetical protein|nr:hypothetical protein [Candidatus Methylacidiphilales bacterium]
MTTPARARLWLPPISLVACALITVLISCVRHLSPLAVTGQAVFLIVILRAFCYWPPMIRWIVSMPVAHRVVFGVLIGCMVLGHYTLNGRTYFPFVVWEIFPFAREDDPVTCREFIATTAKGDKVRLLVEQVFPSIVQVNPLDGYSPEATEHLARALAKVYNERHADDPVRQVDLMVMAVKLHPPPGESRAQPSCELLKHYDISSGR